MGPFFAYGAGSARPLAFPTQGGQPILIDQATVEACCCVRDILFTSLAAQDDDLRITVGGIVVSDTRWGASSYYGETYLGYNGNPSWATVGFRILRITREMASSAGTQLRKGQRVDVDVFDGYATGWRTAPWEALITWMDGSQTVVMGGSLFLGTSEFAAPVPIGDYYSSPPAYAVYHPNGSFTLAR